MKLSKKPAPILLTVKEVSHLLRIHRPKVYELIKRGDIDGFKIGADWRIKRPSIERYVGEITEDMLSGIDPSAAIEAEE